MSKSPSASGCVIQVEDAHDTGEMQLLVTGMQLKWMLTTEQGFFVQTNDLISQTQNVDPRQNPKRRLVASSLT